MSATSEAALAKLTARERAAVLAAVRRELRAELEAERKARKADRGVAVRETPEVAAAAVRMVKALGRRAGLDVEALPLLAELRELVDDELAAAITAARSPERHAHPYSWADVARVLGGDRQRWQQWHARRVGR